MKKWKMMAIRDVMSMVSVSELAHEVIDSNMSKASLKFSSTGLN